FSAQGAMGTILNNLTTALNPDKYCSILLDIKALLSYFAEVTDSKEHRLLLTTVKTNMCRRFHSDINDLRMLCTYSGPGTLWLTDDNINTKALETSGNNESIVLVKERIQQAKTGAVVLLKGALYPSKNAKAVVHRSPNIEEYDQERLLLRIDTNESLNI
ncbi:MAG: DUF1826 domain-containing protein, partial [Bacteroidota bacterium]